MDDFIVRRVKKTAGFLILKKKKQYSDQSVCLSRTVEGRVDSVVVEKETYMFLMIIG